MKNLLPLSAFALLLLSFAMNITSCKKSKNAPELPTYMLNSQFKNDYNFQPGTYWVYKDSVNGEVDSAFVTNSSITTIGEIVNGDILPCEYIRVEMSLICTTPPVNGLSRSRNERWVLKAMDSTLSLYMHDEADSFGFEYSLLSYPITKGVLPVLHIKFAMEVFDSANVTDIYPSFTVQGNTFSTVAFSHHQPQTVYRSHFVQIAANEIYNDNFHISGGTGIVKAALNYTNAGVYRSLELQRYNIVR